MNIMNNKVVLSIHLASFKTIHSCQVGTLQACIFTGNYHNCAHACELQDALVHAVTQFAHRTAIRGPAEQTGSAQPPER